MFVCENYSEYSQLKLLSIKNFGNYEAIIETLEEFNLYKFVVLVSLFEHL